MFLLHVRCHLPCTGHCDGQGQGQEGVTLWTHQGVEIDLQQGGVPGALASVNCFPRRFEELGPFLRKSREVFRFLFFFCVFHYFRLVFDKFRTGLVGIFCSARLSGQQMTVKFL